MGFVEVKDGENGPVIGRYPFFGKVMKYTLLYVETTKTLLPDNIWHVVTRTYPRTSYHLPTVIKEELRLADEEETVLSVTTYRKD